MSRLPTIENQQRKPYQAWFKRCRMGYSQAPAPCTKGVWTSGVSGLARNTQCYFLCATYRMSVGNATSWPTSLHYCVWLFSEMAAALRIWQQIHDKVRHQLRQELGRDERSTVAIADSQSVKTTEKKGRFTVSMVARRLKGVNAISS